MTETLDELRRTLSLYLPPKDDSYWSPTPGLGEQGLVEDNLEELLGHDDTREMLGWWLFAFEREYRPRILGDFAARRCLLTGPIADRRLINIPGTPAAGAVDRLFRFNRHREFTAAVRRCPELRSFSEERVERLTVAARDCHRGELPEVMSERLDVGEDSTIVKVLVQLFDETVETEEESDQLRPRWTDPNGRWLAPGGDPAHSDLGESLTDDDLTWLAPHLDPGIFDWIVAARRLATWLENPPWTGQPMGVGWAFSNGEERESSVADLCGRERMLIDHWRSSEFPADLRPKMVAFARQMIRVGLWGGDWVKLTVRIPESNSHEFPERVLTWHNFGAPALPLAGHGFNPRNSPAHRVEILIRRHDIQHLTVEIINGPPDFRQHLTAQEMELDFSLMDVESMKTRQNTPGYEELTATRHRKRK
jgi:hypothetical protein